MTEFSLQGALVLLSESHEVIQSDFSLLRPVYKRNHCLSIICSFHLKLVKTSNIVLRAGLPDTSPECVSLHFNEAFAFPPPPLPSWGGQQQLIAVSVFKTWLI